MASGYEQKIWNYLKNKIGNEYGVAGLMGNLYAESGLHPDIVQGDIPYSNYSKNYTAQVDSGAISKTDFVHNGPNGGGYGLAQWTFYTRKQGLYEKWKNGKYSSIGSIDLALDFLWVELTASYSGVLQVLKNAASVKQASDKVLHDFERPADQSTAVEQNRASLGQAYYNQFAGTGGSVPEGGGTGGDTGDTDNNFDNSSGVEWKPTNRKMSLLLMYGAVKRRK